MLVSNLNADTEQSFYREHQAHGKEAYFEEGGLRCRGYFKRSWRNEYKLPLITVITVVCNDKDTIVSTIKSVINLEYANIEYIIIDGLSSDGTLNHIRGHSEYIDYYLSQEDKGVYDAMNKGIQLARGDWLCFINSGDLVLHIDPNTLLDNECLSCYYFDSLRNKMFRDPLTKMYLCRNTPCHQSIFYPKSKIKLYDLRYPIMSDFEQLTRVVSRTWKPKYNNSIVYFASPRISAINVLGTTFQHWNMLVKRCKIIYKNLGLFYFVLACGHSLRIIFYHFILKPFLKALKH